MGMHLCTMFHHFMFNGSQVIVLTNKQTNPQTNKEILLKTSIPRRSAMLRWWKTTLFTHTDMCFNDKQASPTTQCTKLITAHYSFRAEQRNMSEKLLQDCDWINSSSPAHWQLTFQFSCGSSVVRAGLCQLLVWCGEAAGWVSDTDTLRSAGHLYCTPQCRASSPRVLKQLSHRSRQCYNICTCQPYITLSFFTHAWFSYTAVPVNTK